jgi:ParB family chromosome partitioning protein
MLRDLPADQITRRADARAVNSDTVSGLVDSIGAVGLINPIRVRQSGEGWEVIAGVHRLEACKALGLAEVACDVVTDDDLHAELAMIDENLCRAELSPSDRARQTARRKAIYEELNPDTVQHVAGGKARQETASDKLSFAAATADATGRDARTVQRDAERGQKILPEVLDMIRGTKLDTGTYMDKLKSMPGSDQFKAAQRDLLHLRHQERVAMQARTKIKVADAPLNDEAAQERQVAALMSAWNKASAEARQEFLDRIDTPVMDRAAQ